MNNRTWTNLSISIFLGFIIAGLLSSCAKSNSAGSSGAALNLSPSTEPQTVSLTLKSGRGFTCFLINYDSIGRIYCKGSNTNQDINLNTSSYISFARKEGFASYTGSFFFLQVYDDTICFSTYSSLRPQARNQGYATYCVGEATLAGHYSLYPIVYGGPQYTPANNDTPEMTYHSQPFMGGDITMETHLSANYVTDGTSLTSSQTENCEISNNTLTCPSFSLGL